MNLLQFKKTTDNKELTEIYKLRYKVYCDEWGFERPGDHPGGLETDEFDESSVHFVAINESSRELIGTIRIILNSEKGFPIERHCRIDSDMAAVNRERVGEISRLAVSKEYRRRAEDRFIYEGVDGQRPQVPVVVNDMRRRQEIICGLYKSMYIESKKIGLAYWYAVMAKGLQILLKRMGIIFTAIGPETDYHGLRTPYLADIAEIEREVSRNNPDFYDYLIT